MSAKETREMLRRSFDEEANSLKGDRAKISAYYDRYWSPEVIYHSNSAGDMNFEQAKQFMIAFLSAFGPKMKVNHVIVDEDMAVVHFDWSGTHNGTFMGIPATGKKVNLKQVMIFKMAGDKAREIWTYYDSLGIMRQLGAIPGPAAAK